VAGSGSEGPRCSAMLCSPGWRRRVPSPLHRSLRRDSQTPRSQRQAHRRAASVSTPSASPAHACVLLPPLPSRPRYYASIRSRFGPVGTPIASTADPGQPILPLMHVQRLPRLFRDVFSVLFWSSTHREADTRLCFFTIWSPHRSPLAC
jgi:hypothetical protein